jgi:hypothetical protein
LLSFNSESVFPAGVLEYKKFWEELTAYFSFSVTSVSDTTSGKMFSGKIDRFETTVTRDCLIPLLKHQLHTIESCAFPVNFFCQRSDVT